MPRHTTNEVPTANRKRVVGEFMSVEDAIDRYRDEWVLMYATERDEHHWPSRGYVLAHSHDRDDLNDVLAKEPLRSSPDFDRPPGTYYPFFAVPRVRSGPAYEAAIKQFIADFEAMKKRGSGAGSPE